MITLLIIFIIATAILLILITAVQSSKKEGLGHAFGSMGASQIIGVKKTSDLLEQATWGLIVLLFALTLASTHLLKSEKSRKMPQSPNIERAYEKNQLSEFGQADTLHTTEPQETQD